MNSILRSLAVAALALLPVFSLALAQDAAAPLRRPIPDRAPSPTPSPTPTPAASPPAPANVPAAPEATPAPTPAASRRTINEPPVRAVEPRASRPADEEFRRESRRAPAEQSGPASRPTFDLSSRGAGSIAASIRGLEKRWQRAVVNKEIEVLKELVADDFIGTSSTGRVGGKTTLIYEARRDANSYTTSDARNMMVRVFGTSVAVVTGLIKERGTTSEGEKFSVTRHFTDTWMRRDGQWQCIASHVSRPVE